MFLHGDKSVDKAQPRCFVIRIAVTYASYGMHKGGVTDIDGKSGSKSAIQARLASSQLRFIGNIIVDQCG